VRADPRVSFSLHLLVHLRRAGLCQHEATGVGESIQGSKVGSRVVVVTCAGGVVAAAQGKEKGRMGAKRIRESADTDHVSHLGKKRAIGLQALRIAQPGFPTSLLKVAAQPQPRLQMTTRRHRGPLFDVTRSCFVVRVSEATTPHRAHQWDPSDTA